VRVRFGPFVIDADTRQLLRDGAALHLSPKAFELLCSLIEHRPRVVEKAALQARLWPDTYVVEGNLNVLIGEIRRAIADDARQPRFIRTVHGMGYAFCGDAVSVEAAPWPRRPMPCWLVAKAETFRLAEGENIVGRDPECAVWLDSPSVSRRHARIVVEGADRRVSVEDLDSKNGTRLGKTPVHERVHVSDGDEIVFGSVHVKLRSWSPETAAETKRISRQRR
jgi:DNA-binding winged helix-turn-helix (wHTH) protein